MNNQKVVKVKTDADLLKIKKNHQERLNKYRYHILVCSGSGCISSNCDQVRDALLDAIKEQGLNEKVLVSATGCIGTCAIGPVMVVMPEGVFYSKLSPADIPQIVASHLVDGNIVTEKTYFDGKTGKYIPHLKDIDYFRNQVKIALRNCGNMDYASLEAYIGRDGYQALSKILSSMKPADVVAEIKKSGLRGRGGGGFPTGVKWEAGMNASGTEKYIVCNADEGDPGAFMDRSLLEGDPHSVIEGMMIAGYTIGANKGYVYVRAEYPLAVERLSNAIESARASGLLGTNILQSKFQFDLEIRIGAGAFVCGEETALMASIEGERGEPRQKPPFPFQKGLFGKPTIINNVETFANVPAIILKGGAWFADFGTSASKGTKVFALAGDINNTGILEVPMGVSLGDVVFDIGGGIPRNKRFKAAQTGGPSGGCITNQYLNTPVDYDSLIKLGAIMGSGGLIIMDEDTCMVDVAKYFLTFIQNESCGKCVPCREGTKRMLEIIERIPVKYSDDKDKKRDQLQRFKGVIHLQRLADVIRDTSLCGLGQSAPNPVLSGLRYFREEYDEHLFERKCEAKVCKELLTYEIDPEICNGCGVCLRKCPVEAIMGEKKQPHQIIQLQCTKCGMCFDSCRFEAIQVN